MSRILINQYRRDLETRIRYGGSRNESSVRFAFANLLNGYCKPRNFILVDELTIKSRINTSIRPDGIIKDALRLDWGYWESKDEKDTIDAEIETKFKKGYPTDNILFEDTKTAVLIQNGEESLRIDMENDEDLDKLINLFLDYERAEVKDFRQAINTFSEDLPTILDTLRKLIDSQSPSPLAPLPQGEGNKAFIEARDKFLKVCQESINPDIKIADIREMIIQHILTEDIFTNIFNDAQFHQENNIARQLNEVIKTFFTGSVKKNTFKTIQSYYNAIIRTASSIDNHHEKQKFLKVVYETFYKAYNPKEADRLGIVYTPNEIVKFMVESTDYLLTEHFQKSLGDKGVEILDPATGTGTFITEILEHLLPRDIEYKYKNEIHCNEVSILPYYIANLNIEYTYQQRKQEYLEFNNICLVDTLHPTDKGEKQMSLFGMNEENTERIKRQNERKISVIIGNPPYNAKQENFNDNNANRKYDSIDKRIKDTYIKEGTAQNQIVVYDMYTRFIRWATDRLNDEGIIAFITNSSLIDARAFDGFRKCLENEFTHIYIIDLGGNIRANPKLSGTTHNVFGIQTGVTITFLIKTNKNFKSPCKIYYSRRPEFETNTEKLAFISQHKLENIIHESELISPDKKHNWINLTDNDFDDLIPLINKDVKAGKVKAIKNKETGELENKTCDEAIFQLFSNGLKTQRDEWVYDIDKNNLKAKLNYLIDIYKETLKDSNYQDKDKIKWDRELSKYLDKKIEKEFNSQQIIKSNYRPFYHQFFYFDKHFNGMTYQWFNMYNSDDLDNEYNLIITISGIAHTKPFSTYIINSICDLGFIETCQCLPLYRYENGERIDNITDWALALFRERYDSYYTPTDGVTMGLSPLPNFLSLGLSESSKLSENWWFVTFVTHNSRVSERMITYGVQKGEPLIFTEEDRIFIAEKILESVKNYNLNVITFNVLPDHVHLIIGTNTEKELSEYIRKIKGFTSFQFQRFHNWEKGQKVWAQKFHREVIEEESHLLNGIDYIENNHFKHGENWGEKIIETWENNIKIIVEKTKNLTRGLSPLSDYKISPLPQSNLQKLINKEDIFNYIYGVLHNPEYREKYELNLKREFPRIPFYDDFWQWSKWGKQLMDLHLNYETIKPYKLTRIDIPLNNPETTPKPKLKADKTNHKIILDEVTTLEKIPSEAWKYKLT